MTTLLSLHPTDVLLAVLIILMLAVLILALVRRPASDLAQVPLRTILLALALALFILAGFGALPGVPWGLAALAAALLC